MRNSLPAVLVLASALIVPSLASADEVADRTQAIRLCRAEVASQAGVEAGAVRLDQVRVRGSSVRVDLDLWREGRLQNIRCDVTRGDTPTIASITPAVQTASAQ